MNIDWRKLVTTVSLGIVFVWAVFWIANHSFVSIKVSNNATGDITYNIVNTKDGRTVTNTTSSQASFRKLVRRGQYQVSVEQNNNSYLTVVGAGGFFKTQKAEANLKPEQARTFVGDSPDACMLYVNVLISNNCGGPYSKLKTHLAATGTLPTYAMTDNDSLKATTEGFVTTPEGTFLLVQQPVSEDDTLLHILYKMDLSSDKPASLNRVVDLSSLNGNTTYSIQPYLNGFVIHDAAFSQVFYYASVSAQGSPLNLSPKDKALDPQSLTASKEGLVAAYSNLNALDKKSLKKPKSEFVVLAGNNVQYVTLDNHYNSGLLCGQSKLCLLEGNRLDVYDITDKPKRLYSLADVQALADGAIVTSRGLLNFDLENRDGYYSYSLGNFSVNTLTKTADGVLLRLLSPQNRTYALLVSPGANDQIDKKMLELENLPEVTAVSVYKNFVHFTPDLGEPSYNPETGFGFDPATRKKVADSINAAIDKIGIDRSAYTIVNAIP